MKNPFNKNSNKNEEPSILITAHLEEPNLLQVLIERLAEGHCDFGYDKKNVQVGWQAIEPSSVESFVSGSIIVSDENDLTSIPFVTCFLFSCVKAKQGHYTLTWSSSLS
jgi:hypothetical protein